MHSSKNDLIAQFNNGPPIWRFWGTLVPVYAQRAIEFFNYFLVGYLVAVLD
jgi:hypothetical protein